MKTIQLGCKRLIAAAVVAAAFAANADTIVHYTFDDLGGVGDIVTNATTVINKANPGTLNGTVYGLVGTDKSSSSVRMPYVTNGVPESLRVLDPVGGTLASAADKALRFWRTHGAGNGAMVEIPNDPALRPSSFTVEMFVRVDPEHTNWEMIACQPSTTAGLFGWGINFYKPGDNSYLNFQLNFVDTAGVNHQHGIAGSTLLGNKWHHIALTVKPQSGDPSKINIKFFIDYVRVYYYDAPYGIVLPDSSDCPVQIGGTTAQGQHFAGEIGEFRFSDKELDLGEFLRPHNKAIDKDVVLYYDFEEDNAYEGAFSATDALANKASPILPGRLQTMTFDTKGTLPKVDGEAAPDSSLRQSMSDPDWADNASSLFNGYEGGQRYNNYLYCDLPSSMSLADTNFTVEMFCKTDGSVNWWTSVFRDTNDQVWIGGAEDGNKFIGRVTLDDTTQMRVNDTVSLNDGKWHHIALVREGTALTLYRDKKVAASTTLTSSSLKAIGTRWQFIGGPNEGSNDFNGWLDSVRVTRRALGPEEFLTSQHYPESSTIAHLKFDDGSANAADGGCALFNGVINSATFSDDVPGYKIIDGEGGAVLSKPDVASLSLPSTSAKVVWSNWDDQYYLRKDTNGVERTSGTVELWVKGSVKKTFAAILDAKMTANGAYNDNLHIWRLGYDPTDGGKPRVLFRCLKTDGTRDNQSLTFDREVTDGKWHHWAFTFQPNASDSTKSDIAFYLDHVQIGNTQTLKGRVAYDDTLRFAIGESGSSFTGLIDEVRISDCVLAPSEFLHAEKQHGLILSFR
ncbi:MAG: LamG domain-containing protein [Kiritimatiellae bacterium]|nr:LamG domain-containing protein [Kiritimatiellia bacterium]